MEIIKKLVLLRSFYAGCCYKINLSFLEKFRKLKHLGIYCSGINDINFEKLVSLRSIRIYARGSVATLTMPIIGENVRIVIIFNGCKLTNFKNIDVWTYRKIKFVNCCDMYKNYFCIKN